MRAQLVWLLIGSLALWGSCALIGGLVLGPTAVLDTAVACGLCLVPMVATLLWAQAALGGAPEDRLLAVLGGTGIRLFVALVGGIGLYHAVERLHRPAFLLWVIVFYLATLALEIVMVVRQFNRLDDKTTQSVSQPRP